MDTILVNEVSLKFAGGTLRQFAAQVSRDYKIKVQVDDRALENVGIFPDTKVMPFELSHASLGAALWHMLRECDLRCVPRDDVLLITTHEECDCALYFSFFPVFDICYGPEAQLNLKPANLMRLIEETARPTSWEVVGGPGTISYVPQAGCLAVAQSSDAMSEVTAILSRYREMIHAYRSNPMVFSSAPIALDADRRTADVRDRLRMTRVTCDFADVPLSQAVRDLSRLTKLPLVISHRNLEDVGLAADTKISAVGINAPLRDVLRDMLAPLDLSTAVYNEVIVVTQIETDCGWDLVMHPTADIAHDFPNAAQQSPTEVGASLAELIQETVVPESWEDLGGAGCVRAMSNGAALIVFQSPSNQLRVEEKLQEYRRASR